MVAAATSPPIFTVIAIIHLLKVSTDAFISRNALGTSRYSRCLTLHEPCDTHHVARLVHHKQSTACCGARNARLSKTCARARLTSLSPA